jgi:hypothetical protein
VALTLALPLLLLPSLAAAGFTWDIEHTGSVNSFFEIEAFHTTVTNTGSVPDTVLVNMVKILPAGWVASLCEDLLCYPPSRLDVELVLAPGQATELIIDITPTTNLGQGSTLITLTSRNNPADTADASFAVISTGIDVLLVNDLPGTNAEAQLTAAIAATGRTVAIWNPVDMGKAATADLALFEAVIWAAGDTQPGLDLTDMFNLSGYVSGGGRLLLSGQNLAYASCDPASPYQSAFARTWFSNTLGVDYVADVGGTTTVSGGAGNPVFPDLAFALNGGDGSSNNTSPDEIAGAGSGVTGLSYDGGGTALVLNTPTSGQTAFAAFGIEGLASGAERSLFLTRIFAWFAGQTTAVADGQVPVLAGPALAWPNPFNPRTTIAFAVGGDRAVPATVTVHDLRGRAVSRLYRGQ